MDTPFKVSTCDFVKGLELECGDAAAIIFYIMLVLCCVTMICACYKSRSRETDQSQATGTPEENSSLLPGTHYVAPLMF
tara:strand:+ start:795 stop:1031 length:237 start_codon:yes stop_codon:yes gene_type:complete